MAPPILHSGWPHEREATVKGRVHISTESTVLHVNAPQIPVCHLATSRTRFGRVGAVLISLWANLGTHYEAFLRKFPAMTMLRSFVGIAVLLLPFVSADAAHKPTTTAPPVPKSTSLAELNLLAKLEGKLYFGTATDNGELTDKPYKKVLDNLLMFGQITPANSMKWVRNPSLSSFIALVLILESQESTEPNRGNFTFAGGDAIRDLARRNGQLLRGKSLTRVVR